MDTHVEAEVTFLTTEAGGRRAAIFQRYRPRVSYDGQDWEAQFIFSQRGVKPGQTVVVGINFMNPAAHAGKLVPGKPFEFKEGEQVVGHGVVTRLVDLPV